MLLGQKLTPGPAAGGHFHGLRDGGNLACPAPVSFQGVQKPLPTDFFRCHRHIRQQIGLSVDLAFDITLNTALGMAL